MKKYFLGIVIIIIIAAGFYFGTKEKTASNGFNLGLISILSGDYAAVGDNVKNGVVLANEMYNKANPEAPITLTIEDDGFTGGKGVSAYQKLVNTNKINALINVSTPTIDAIYDTVSKTDLPVVQIGEQGRDPLNDNVFGMFPSSVASSYDYGVYLREKGVKEISLVYTNIAAMIRFVDSFKKGFEGKTADYIINTDEKDLRTHALKVAATKPDNIGFFIFPQQGAQFVKEFMKVKKNNTQLFFDASFQSGYTDYQRILGDLTMLDGTLIGTVDSTFSENFKAEYKARFGTEAGFLSDMGYDGFNLLVATHSTDSKKWLENIKKVNLNGAGGKIEFDENGNRKPKTKIMVLSGGKISDLK